MAMGLLVGAAMLPPFPFYYVLWTFPQAWVNLCGPGVDPCRRMALVSHAIRAVQLLAFFSVAHFRWPPWYCCLLFAAGQFLNVRVYQLLGESGTYYGARFGKTIPWVTEFPYGFIKDPQYMGSIMSIVACLCWVPFQYVFLWSVGYLFMMKIESKEDPSTRAKHVS